MVYKAPLSLSCKKSIFFLFLALTGFFISAQNTFVPDDNFEQALIDLGYDAGPLDDFVPTLNINGITNLDVSAKNISDLTGIENFTALAVLTCEENNLTSINTSQNLLLKQLFCSRNQITDLDVSKNTNLSILWCSNNQLTTLDVTKNNGLISIVCDGNLLTGLDISQNPDLTVLECSSNQITSLDVSNNQKINRLECGNNLLNTLDLSKLANLTFLECNNNQLTVLDVSNNNLLINLNCAFNQLSKLDLSSIPGIINLNCGNNILCFLNVKNGNNVAIASMDFSSNPNLNCVVVDNPSGNHNSWMPAAFTNYVSSPSNCNNFVNVDKLNNVVAIGFYALPVLVNGDYFTESKGNGTPLQAGDLITTSQTIYIYNETTCNSNETTFSVFINNPDFFIPKFFTPNNDGTNDVWKITDKLGSLKNIAIYDRHGKLLKNLDPNSQGWNGTFKGKLLNTDDYWYVISLFSGETLKGHFTLKR